MKKEFTNAAKEAGFEFYTDDENFYIGELACTTVLTRFAKLVEQATLERAAKHFDKSGKYADGSWSEVWYDAESPGIILRALKDPHD